MRINPHELRLQIVVLLSLVGGVIGCAQGGEEAVEPAAVEPAAVEPAAEPPSTEPRVFFAEPEDGATIGTLTLVKFAAENFTIEPVGDGMIHEGAGHYHIGLDTDCLPPGEVIPTADPWIHFGDGSSEIEMQLEPGHHRLTLQIGDGEHRTLEGDGMCATIEVHVEDEGEEDEGE